jgi:DNA polymerase-3 subunit alpha
LSIIFPNRFVSLHSHSGESTFDGMDPPSDHIDFVLKNGLDAWCLTDHGHMNGYASAYLHSKKLNEKGSNFKFIPGCEMYLHPDLSQWKKDYELQQLAKSNDKKSKLKLKEQEASIKTKIVALVDEDDDPVDVVISDEESLGLTVENEDETKSSSKFYDPVKRRHHMVVLPRTSEGLQRLFSLVSKGYSDGFYRFPRIDYKMLKEASKGGHLLITSACIGGNISYEVFKHLQNLSIDNLSPSLYDDPSIRKAILNGIGNEYDKMVDAVGRDSAFLELQFNNIDAQHLSNRAIIDFATQNGIQDKLIVACDSHYANPDNWRERELYKKLGWLGNKNFEPSMLPKSKDELKCELYPKNANQVWDSFLNTTKEYSFYDHQLICNAIERTHDIAHEMIGNIEPDTSMKLPSWVVPEGLTADKQLLELCKKGLIEKGLHENKEYLERIKEELRVIKDKKFAQYFLTKSKIIDIAWKNMFVGPGRGSGAGSLVNYVLGITNVDPIEYGLLFERFLDPTRTEYPDIDTDVSDRDFLIDNLKKEFGSDNVVPISNYMKFKIKSLIKDVSKFYGIEFQEVNKALAPLEKDVKEARRKINGDPVADITLDEALQYCESVRDFLEKYPEIMEPINVLFKQNRALGRHAGGVVVSEHIKEKMPLIQTRGEFQTPWVEGMTAKHLEPFGWVKFDLLGLETLRMFEMTIKLILQKEGLKNPTFDDIKSWYIKNLDPSVVNFNDQKVYENVYHEGKFVGIFQCTQRGAQSLFKKAKPRNITDIAALTSIYRPGPLSAKVDKTYINAKSNPELVDYGHKLIKDCLSDTFGHIIFQEQAMALCNVVAGIPKLELNKVRKMMKPGGSSDENVTKAKELKERFITGSVANGVKEETANQLYEKILYFSGYGFNKSHAVCYAINSFYCAWFLTYYENEWVCAYLEACSNNPKKLSKAISEVKSLGYKISKLDINTSENSWTCINGNMLVPSFASIKGIGDTAVEEIMENRPYNNFDELFWNKDGSWKHSKFNKKAFQVLLQLRAFESIPDWKTYFSSYKNFHDVVINNWDKLKKSTKNDPFKGKTNFLELVKNNDNSNNNEWNIKELSQFSLNLTGTLTLDSLIPQSYLEKLEEKSIESIDEFDENETEGVFWFMVSDALIKKTKNGKNYLLLNVLGNSGQKHRMFVWSYNVNQPVSDYSIYAAQVSRGDYGYSTNFNKLIKLL